MQSVIFLALRLAIRFQKKDEVCTQCELAKLSDLYFHKETTGYLSKAFVLMSEFKGILYLFLNFKGKSVICYHYLSMSFRLLDFNDKNSFCLKQKKGKR